MTTPLIPRRSGGAVGRTQRSFVRRPANQPAELRWVGSSVVVDVLDISEAGARCRVFDAFPLDRQAQVDLVLLDGSALSSVVRWKRRDFVALEFRCRLADVSDITNLDHLGFEYFRSIAQLQKKRRQPKVLEHSDFEGNDGDDA